MLSNDFKSISGLLRLLAWSSGLGITFLSFVYFLQTPVASIYNLSIAGAVFVLATAAALLILSRRLIPLLERSKDRNSIVLTAFLLSILFLPLYFTSLEFPVSPLLRPQTDVAVQIDLADNSRPVALSNDDVLLVMDKEAFGLRTFEVQSGRKATDHFVLLPGGSEFFRWQGSADEVVVLNVKVPPASGTLIIYWDRERTTYHLSSDVPTEIAARHKFETPFALNVLFFFAEYAVLSFVMLILAVLLKNIPTKVEGILQDKKWKYALLAAAVLLSAVLIKLQVDGIVGGIPTLNTEQLERHTDVLQGRAPNPWQYRVLSEWIAAGFVKLFGFLPAPDAVVFGFLSFRLLQNIAILICAFLLYKRLGNSSLLGLLGIFLLAASMKNALFESDLSFNTYFDLLFYLLAALLILDKKYLWIIPLMFFASLNRETSGLIPFLLLSAAWTDSDSAPFKRMFPAFLSLVVWGIVFAALRFIYPGRPLFIPYDRAPGFSLLIYNLTRPVTWTELFHTLGFIPLLGLPVFFAWHSFWKRFFFILIPVWFGIHAVASVMAETRLFLVPQALIFIPGIIFLVRHLAGLIPVEIASK